MQLILLMRVLNGIDKLILYLSIELDNITVLLIHENKGKDAVSITGFMVRSFFHGIHFRIADPKSS